MRTLVLSDLHLGSRACNAVCIRDLLVREPFDRLVLNGETVNNLNLRKFRPCHWQIVDRLRALGGSRELVLVRGNHDHDYDPVPHGDSGTADGPGFGTRDVLPALLGVPMVEEYPLEAGGRRYLVLHGDRFDPTFKLPAVTEVGAWCYHLSHKLSKKLAKWLKKQSKRWGGVLEYVRCQSVAYARERGAGGVITGHTHFAEDVHFDGVHYLNTGCWTEPPCTYVTADARAVRLHHLPD